MRKLLLSIVFSLSLFLPFLMTVQPVIAQEEEETLIAPYEEYDWE
jgi:protein-S-isoprenylcysteine O-methyltransferase Ste14